MDGMPPGLVTPALDERQLEVVKRHQENALASNTEEGLKWCQLREDYLKLKQTLRTLPERSKR